MHWRLCSSSCATGISSWLSSPIPAMTSAARKKKLNPLNFIEPPPASTSRWSPYDKHGLRSQDHPGISSEAFRRATGSIRQLPSPFGAERQEGGRCRNEVFAVRKPELRRMGVQQTKPGWGYRKKEP